jgi:hypothetical protein
MLKNPVTNVYCPNLKNPWVKPYFVFIVKAGTMQQILDKRGATK